MSSRITNSDVEEPEKQYPRLQHVLSPEKTAISTIFGNSSSRFQALPVGSDLEVSPTSFKLARKVGELLAKRETDAGPTPGGCGLIIDYGNENAFGNSRRVRYIDILLSVTVDPQSLHFLSGVQRSRSGRYISSTWRMRSHCQRRFCVSQGINTRSCPCLWAYNAKSVSEQYGSHGTA